MAPDGAFFTLPPDWICILLSRSTEKVDREDKMPIYASAGVEYAWLVHPRRRTLEAFRRRDGQWHAIAVHKDTERARIAPFEALELDLAVLWAHVPLPTRAGEEPAVYSPSGEVSP